jgi:hypothetical protein
MVMFPKLYKLKEVENTLSPLEIVVTSIFPPFSMIEKF